MLSVMCVGHGQVRCGPNIDTGLYGLVGKSLDPARVDFGVLFASSWWLMGIAHQALLLRTTSGQTRI